MVRLQGGSNSSMVSYINNTITNSVYTQYTAGSISGVVLYLDNTITKLFIPWIIPGFIFIRWWQFKWNC